MLKQPDRKSCKAAPKAEESHPQGHPCPPQRAVCRSWCCHRGSSANLGLLCPLRFATPAFIQRFPGMPVRALAPEAAEGEAEAQRCSFFHSTLGDPIPALSSLGLWHCPSQPLQVSFPTHAPTMCSASWTRGHASCRSYF